MLSTETELRNMFEGFALAAGAVWGPEAVRCLHPLDVARLAGVVRRAHATWATLSPEDVYDALVARGFQPALAASVAQRYAFGRIVLAMAPHPWNRSGTREERIRMQQSFRLAAFGERRPQTGSRSHPNTQRALANTADGLSPDGATGRKRS